jgi:hypothetical protein
MATLTYDPTEFQEGELSADEQESLQIGETLEQEQQQLLAGKFKDAEDLEQAYIELQKKLGDPNQRNQQPEEEQPQDEVEPPQEEVDIDFLDQLWQESLDEYSDDTLNKLQEMDPTDLAQMYLEYRAKVENQEPVQTLQEADVEQLQAIVGGQEQYTNMMGWAKDNLSENEIEMYDAVMDRGDPLACFFAVQALAYRFQDASGVDGQLLTGTTPSSSADVFRSQAELVRAMSDPRYDSDPAYRMDVAEKLERSNLGF